MNKIVKKLSEWSATQCPKCGKWWPTTAEAGACFSSHF